MADEHPVGHVIRFWMVVNIVVLIIVTLIWLYLLFDYPKIYSIFIVQPGSVINIWRFGSVTCLFVCSVLGLYGFVTNNKLCIRLFLGLVSIALFVLHLMIYMRTPSDFVTAAAATVKSVAGGTTGTVANWKPSSELGLAKINQFALDATSGEKINTEMISQAKRLDLQSVGDLLPFSSLVLTCCGPFDEGYGPRRQCHRDDMPAKDSICSSFYMSISALNYVALIGLTGIFWFLHALTSIKLVSHKLPQRRSSQEGQTYIVPEGRVKTYDKSDYATHSSTLDSRISIRQ